MDVNNLAPYFEVFAGLNLAYVGVSLFRKDVYGLLELSSSRQRTRHRLDELIEELQIERHAFVQGVNSKLPVESTIHDLPAESTILDDFSELIDDLSTKAAEDNELKDDFLSNVAGFKPLFVSCFTFSLSCLLVIGVFSFDQGLAFKGIGILTTLVIYLLLIITSEILRSPVRSRYVKVRDAKISKSESANWKKKIKRWKKVDQFVGWFRKILFSEWTMMMILSGVVICSIGLPMFQYPQEQPAFLLSLSYFQFFLRHCAVVILTLALLIPALGFIFEYGRVKYHLYQANRKLCTELKAQCEAAKSNEARAKKILGKMKAQVPKAK